MAKIVHFAQIHKIHYSLFSNEHNQKRYDIEYSRSAIECRINIALSKWTRINLKGIFIIHDYIYTTLQCL